MKATLVNLSLAIGAAYFYYRWHYVGVGLVVFLMLNGIDRILFLLLRGLK